MHIETGSKDVVVLKQYIEQKRKKMHSLLKDFKEMDREELYRLSVELDKLIVQYHKTQNIN